MTKPLIVNIEQAQKDKDFHVLCELGHSLKGAALSACCNHLGKLADDLQERAEAKKGCATCVKNIVKEFKRVKEDIKNLF